VVREPNLVEAPPVIKKLGSQFLFFLRAVREELLKNFLFFEEKGEINQKSMKNKKRKNFIKKN